MKNKYVVKILIPNRDKLVELLDALPSIDVEVSVVGQEPIVRAPRKPAEERASGNGASNGSKVSVNEAILQRLDNGSASVGELKEALLHAGKSAASLSTGIAALTKAGKIERSSDGVYAKAA